MDFNGKFSKIIMTADINIARENKICNFFMAGIFPCNLLPLII